MVASQKIKEAARSFGADLVGVAPVERLDHLPEINRPRTLAPATRSVIVVGHRINRGAFRGIEEGTNFGSTYNCYGHDWMEDQFLSRTVFHLAAFLEEAGFEAVPLQARRVEGEAFVPDYQSAAVAAGLGEIGRGGFLLTPQYGHRQRVAMIFTDAEIEADAEIAPGLCTGCRACLEACPLGALREEAGKALFALDLSLCKSCRNGSRCEPGRSDIVDRYAASCGRGCLVALEEKIENRFEEKFRKRGVWTRGPVGIGEVK